MRIDPRDLLERPGVTQAAELAPWQLADAELAELPLVAVEAESDAASDSSCEQPSLWDSFWARHGQGNGLANAILWRVRNILSRRHAMILAGALGQSSTSSNPSARFIEIGCGSAATSLFLQNGMPDSLAYGIDRSREAVRLARSINPSLRCVVADAMDLPFAEGAFALAFSSGVIEHFSRTVAGSMLGEHCRVANGHGATAVIVPWKYSAFNALRILAGRFWPFGKEQPFSVNELGSFGAEHGIRDLKVHLVMGSTLLAIGTMAQQPKGLFCPDTRE